MWINHGQLVKMLEAAHEAGQRLPKDLQPVAIEDILTVNKLPKNRELMVYGVDELRKFSIGAKFHHSGLGKCEIASKKGVRQPVMQFENGAQQLFTHDIFPWNVPMMHLEG
jgi:hypothetical protein